MSWRAHILLVLLLQVLLVIPLCQAEATTTDTATATLSDDPAYYAMMSPYQYPQANADVNVKVKLNIYYRLEEIITMEDVDVTHTHTALSVRMVYTSTGDGDGGSAGWISLAFSPLNIPRMINSLAVTGPLGAMGVATTPQLYDLSYMFYPPIYSEELQSTLMQSSMLMSMMTEEENGGTTTTNTTSTTLTFTKLIDNELHSSMGYPTIDPQGKNTCLYAFGDGSAYPYSFHGPTESSRGSFTLDLTNVPIWTSVPTSTSYSDSDSPTTSPSITLTTTEERPTLSPLKTTMLSSARPSTTGTLPSPAPYSSTVVPSTSVQVEVETTALTPSPHNSNKIPSASPSLDGTSTILNKDEDEQSAATSVLFDEQQQHETNEQEGSGSGKDEQEDLFFAESGGNSNSSLNTEGDNNKNFVSPFFSIQLTESLTFQYRLLLLGEGDGRMLLMMEHGEDVFLEVVLTYQGLGWLGWGISYDGSGLMKGSDAVIGIPAEGSSAYDNDDDGTGSVNRYHMKGTLPTDVILMNEHDPAYVLANATILQDTYKQTTTMAFRHRIMEDLIEPTGTHTFLYCIGPNNYYPSYHGKGAGRNAFRVDLAPARVAAQQAAAQGDDMNKTSTSTTTTTSGAVLFQETAGQSKDYTKLFLVHGILGLLAWGMCIPLSVGAAMLKDMIPSNKYCSWIYIHTYGNLAGMAFTVMCFVLALIPVLTPGNGEALGLGLASHSHAIVGWLVTLLVGMQSLVGWFRPPKQQKAEEKEEKAAQKRFVWEVSHRVLGVTLLGGGVWQMSSGCYLWATRYGLSLKYQRVSLLWIGSLVAIIVVTKVGMQLRERRRSRQSQSNTNNIVVAKEAHKHEHEGPIESDLDLDWSVSA
jgi:hypothetical protein